MMLGTIRVELNNVPGAAESFRRALELDPAEVDKSHRSDAAPQADRPDLPANGPSRPRPGRCCSRSWTVGPTRRPPGC